MTDLPALRKRLAEFMGYKWDVEEEVWIADGWMIVGLWHPDEDIAQAMMVAEQTGLPFVLWKIDGKFMFAIGKQALSEAGAHDAPALAISLASDAWLRQGCSK